MEYLKCLVYTSFGNNDSVCPTTVEETSPPGEAVLLMETLHSTPVDSNQIRRWTDRDPVLSKVRRLVQFGWEETDDENMKPYQIRSHTN